MGTLSELNMRLSKVLFGTRMNPSNSLLTPKKQGLTGKSSPRLGKLLSLESLLTGTDLELSCHLRLLSLDPFLVTQTNSFPRSRYLPLTHIYDQLELIQWKMPETADIRFNIKDILPLGLTQDEVYLTKYFQSKSIPLDLSHEYQHANIYLQLLSAIRKRRKVLRAAFISYNVESMQTLQDLLTMNFSTFVSLVKDAMLLGTDFDILDVAKAFYLSYVSSKKLPDSAMSDEKSWLRALIMGSSFKENYHLRFPNFLECLVRLAAAHPRFVRLLHVPLNEKFSLLYKRDLKPNMRMTQAMFYLPLLRDPFITRAIYMYEVELYSMFDGYQTKLSDVEKVTDFTERHGKLELRKFYALLANSGIVLDADIEQRVADDVDAEMLKINGAGKRKTQLHNAKTAKASTIRFPSTLFEKAENKNLKIVATKNVRSSGPSSSLSLPFYRPLRVKFLVDKLTIFNFFISVMQVTSIKSNDDLFLADPKSVSDQHFVISFTEFCETIGLLGLHYWKTTVACEDLSMTEGVSYFIKILVERHRFYRELRGMTSGKLMMETREVMAAYAKETLKSELPLVTKSVLAQERFVQRRVSF